MAIVLYIRNRQAKIIKKLGLIDTEEFCKLTSTAANLNLRCLPYVDFAGDTIFNHRQLLAFIKEIAFLKTQKTEIKKEDLDLLDAAALAALEHPDYYLFINGE